MQKFSQFCVTYWNIVRFDHDLWKLDYFEKSVLELMADSVAVIVIVARSRYHHATSHIILRAPFPFPVNLT